MKNKWLITIIVLLLIIVWTWAFHIANKDKNMVWNPIHNMMMWWKKDMKMKEEMNMKMWKWNDNSMKEHCKMMPEMKWCEKYSDKKVDDEMWDMKWMWMMWKMWGWEIFDNDIENLPEAKKSEIIVLKDWDTYEMVASAVKQEVGNRTIKRLAYNGMIPWPLLQVEKWAKIKLKLTNKLGFETTLHSHWLRLDDSKFDWLPSTMWGEQKPMKDWESFIYELNFPDTWVFWYHPHMREDYTQEMWLYGNFSVIEENYWISVDKEEFMILDDFSEDDVFYKWKVNKTLMGRFGNIMMINNEQNYELKVKTWESIRMFITNVANTRTFDFEIENENWKIQDLKLVWWDIGRIEKEVIIKNQIISPAERYIIETVFNKSWNYIIKSKDRILWKIVVFWEKTNNNLWKLRKNSSNYKNIRDNLGKFLSKKTDKKLRLTIWMQGMQGWMWGMRWMKMWEGEDIDGIEWEDNIAKMNRMSSDKMMEWKLIDEETKKENMDIKWKFKKGDFVKVEIFNDPKSMHPMQHPVHFHGQRFIVLTRDWKIEDNLQWKDTTLVKNWEKIEILIEMTNVWLWMSHCHIAEHLQSGMMMNFRVEE